MTRIDLKELVLKTINAEKQWIYLLMDGDPNSARQRLLGHRQGPYGWVCGHVVPCNIVRFNAQYLQDYLDGLSAKELSGSEDIAAEAPSHEFLQLHCAYYPEQGE